MLKKILIGLALVIIVATGTILYQKVAKSLPKANSGTPSSSFFESKTDNQNGITIEVTPKQVALGEPLEFTLTFTTHEGDLAFDLTKNSALKIGSKELKAQSWDGGSGGHHLSGTLKFPPLDREPTQIILEIRDISAATRIFTWK